MTDELEARAARVNFRFFAAADGRPFEEAVVAMFETDFDATLKRA